MALHLIAKRSEAFSDIKADCWMAEDKEQDLQIDFWLPRGQQPATMDIFVEFEEEQVDGKT